MKTCSQCRLRIVGITDNNNTCLVKNVQVKNKQPACKDFEKGEPNYD